MMWGRHVEGVVQETLRSHDDAQMAQGFAQKKFNDLMFAESETKPKQFRDPAEAFGKK